MTTKHHQLFHCSRRISWILRKATPTLDVYQFRVNPLTKFDWKLSVYEITRNVAVQCRVCLTHPWSLLLPQRFHKCKSPHFVTFWRSFRGWWRAYGCSKKPTLRIVIQGVLPFELAAFYEICQIKAQGRRGSYPAPCTSFQFYNILNNFLLNGLAFDYCILCCSRV